MAVETNSAEVEGYTPSPDATAVEDVAGTMVESEDMEEALPTTKWLLGDGATTGYEGRICFLASGCGSSDA